MRQSVSRMLTLLFACSLLCASLHAQTPAGREWCQNVIIPQTYRSSVASNYQIQITNVQANIGVVEQAATTAIDISLKNNSSIQQTAEMLIPVPEGAIIKSFTFQGKAAEPKTELLVKEKAKATFDSIVAKLKDPALLEFAGYNLVRSSVFPVPAKGDQKVRIVYEHLLKAEGDRVDYELPRSGSVVYDTPWKINLKVNSKRPITTVYSPSHQLTSSPSNKKTVTASVVETATSTPGPFKFSFLLEKGALTASLFNYPNVNGKGGYFLLLAGMGAVENRKEKIQREITLVIDRSGSMGGKKIAQAKEAALQVIEGLEMGESFNIVTYSDEVTSFSNHPVKKSKETTKKARDYIDAIIARGGTNLHAALERSLQGKPNKGDLPIVMFLTDGLPTEGETNEAAIRSLATDHNPNEKRVFTFGVGYDVNTPLLDKIARSTRGFSTFVLPTEDVESKVARVFKGLDGPTLASPEIRVVNAQGKPTPKRVSHLLPKALPDMYSGDQLVLLGKYKGKKPLHFQFKGKQGDTTKTFAFKFPVKQSLQTQNSFVARLWASRRIAELVDKVRDLGADSSKVAQITGSINSNSTPQAPNITFANNKPSATPQLDSKLKEFALEIIALSKEFGILTEYTSFLAEEGTDLSDLEGNASMSVQNFKTRAIASRTGIGSLNQEFNNKAQRSQACLNPTNHYWAANMKRASVTNVQQLDTGAYFRRGNLWISNQLIDEIKDVKVDRTVEIGSPEFNNLVWTLVSKSRNCEMALDGDVILKVNGETILVKNTPAKPETSEKDEETASRGQDKQKDDATPALIRRRW